MEMMFTIAYNEAVIKEDIPKIGEVMRGRIRSAIETKLMTQPALFGKPLRQSLAGYRALRVGDYRVIFRIEKTVVKIQLIAHRSVVYVQAAKRR